CSTWHIDHQDRNARMAARVTFPEENNSRKPE
ncbi:uncharacterized protein METZ01_LOCUS239769, partial [marine metagenome]